MENVAHGVSYGATLFMYIVTPGESDVIAQVKGVSVSLVG